MKWSHSRPWGFITIVHMFEYRLLLVKIVIKRVLNSWDYIEYACSPINIAKVLQDSTLCFSAWAMAMNRSQTPAVRGILCLNLKCVWSMSGKQNLWSGYLFATIWINGSFISRCSLPRITSLHFSVLSHLWNATMQLSSTHPIRFMLLKFHGL